MNVDISNFSIVRELVEIGLGIFGKYFGVFDYGSREAVITGVLEKQ
jgi:hypothetical protein